LPRPISSPISARLGQQFRRAAASGAKAQHARCRVVQPDLAEGRCKALPQRRLATAPRGQPRQRELDVLAGAKRGGREVRATAEVLPRCRAADGHPPARAAGRVVHRELREHRLAAQVVQGEALLGAELPAQRGLPVGRRQLRRPACVRQALRGRLAHLGALGTRLGRGLAGGGGGHGRRRVLRGGTGAADGILARGRGRPLLIMRF
jgi:hypothetical protein